MVPLDDSDGSRWANNAVKLTQASGGVWQVFEEEAYEDVIEAPIGEGERADVSATKTKV